LGCVSKVLLIFLRDALSASLKKINNISRSLPLIAVIENLSEEPRPSGCKKLKGRKDQYRVRSGDYRIIYSVEDALLVVEVIALGHRRDVYEE
jgi:mRNA interferase RelE/StbE